MPTLRLLLALSLIALGTTGAAFAISGYFDPRLWQQEAKAPTADASKAKLDLAILKSRQRFVAIEAKTKPTAAVAAPPPRPKASTAAKAAPAKKPAPSKDANVQQAAAWWPLSNLFKN
jgi:cell division septation protein DedD